MIGNWVASSESLRTTGLGKESAWLPRRGRPDTTQEQPDTTSTKATKCGYGNPKRRKGLSKAADQLGRSLHSPKKTE
ncbi:hypothetical protein TNCV_269861 [Trichonephila clavipes]|nr:hypothetical protein TNCV_269861 [Trichonephila clavipes]